MANSPGYKALLIRSDSRKKVDKAKQILEAELGVELNYSQFIEFACNKIMGSPIVKSSAIDLKPGSFGRYVDFGLELLNSKSFAIKDGEILKLKRFLDASLSQLDLEHRTVIKLFFGLSRFLLPMTYVQIEKLLEISDARNVLSQAIKDARELTDKRKLLTFFETIDG